uniref:Charged multivesicular body protein 6 n=1 Tax=Tetraselmis sp. GSL018 TaxID=582737 RepID=A0A061S574_9CHLO|mmetsp:Transcript_22890/g.54804  ORF Transcript_22890/g.54804 Transcript_22890/m.54804 type:complete len:225 (-) Transcript_22890:162-836(-)
MGNYFQKAANASKGKITELDKAILNLKTQRRKLSDQRTRLETLTSRERSLVKDLLNKKLKQRALLTLKKVKLQEEQLDQIDIYLLRVQELLISIENAKETKSVFDTLRLGADALKAAQSQLSLEEVEKLAEDTAEAKEYEDRLQQLMGESWCGHDDEEVLHELEELERSVFASELPEVPSGASELTQAHEKLPDVPESELENVDALRAKARAAGGKVRAEPVPA